MTAFHIVLGAFSPPDRLYMSNADFVSRQLTFNWSCTVSTTCPAIHYCNHILASNCGSCPTTTNHTSVTCTDVPTYGSMCTFAVQTVGCGNITSNRSVSIRVNTGIVYNHTQTTCDSGVHNSVYIISISSLATTLIISVVVSITVNAIILMRSKAKIKDAFELTNRASMYEVVMDPLSSVIAINTQDNVAYGHIQTSTAAM